MKKLLSVGLLTVCAFAFSEHQAQAWVNSRFSIGLNWHHQSANTSYLWGLWRNGQVPGPEAFGGQGGAPGMGAPGQFGPPQSHPFPFFGSGHPQGGPQTAGTQQGSYQQPMAQNYYPQGYYPQAYQQNIPQGFPQSIPPGFFTETAPPPVNNNAQRQAYAQPNAGGINNVYQAASYQPSSYYQPYYYYPTYTGQVPYYWYTGR